MNKVSNWVKLRLQEDLRHLTLLFKVRIRDYLLMVASQDEETQKKGMVGVVVNMGPDRRESLHLDAVQIVPGLAQAIPIRWACVHFW